MPFIQTGLSGQIAEIPAALDQFRVEKAGVDPLPHSGPLEPLLR